ncbi:MAG: cupin domain-containing protein [Candidatus Altiarchaeota archaeon]|nr:cupin domain-containing protein [Candidatus Altiarchaeota archaeon]
MNYHDIKVVEKPWGREIHFAVENEYVGKILEVHKGHRLSHQFHERKKETLHVYEGRIRLTLGEEVEVVESGKSVTIPPGVNHRIEALDDEAVILEVSTTELDDVVRLDDDYGRHHHELRRK